MEQNKWTRLHTLQKICGRQLHMHVGFRQVIQSNQRAWFCFECRYDADTFIWDGHISDVLLKARDDFTDRLSGIVMLQNCTEFVFC